MPKLKPFGARVLVGEIGPAESVAESGLVLPATVSHRHGLVKGLVLEVGDGLHGISEHDTVYFEDDRVYTIAGKTVVDAQDVIAIETEDE